MMQLTPSSWIGVLIGIVVVGSIVDLATASKKCLDSGKGSGTKLENLKDITAALDILNYGSACGDSCFQYFPPAKGDNRKGAGKVFVECVTGSCVTEDTALTNKVGKDYRCSVCDTTKPETCLTLDKIKIDLKECYSVSTAIDPNSLDDTALSNQKKNLCMDECHYLIAAAKVKVGCKDDIKNGASIVCPVGDVMCEHMIAKDMKCFTKNEKKIDVVAEISQALNRDNWRSKCDPTHKCLIYYPTSDTNKRKGKVNVLLECGVSCITDAMQLRNKIGENYQCSSCDPINPTPCNIDVKIHTTVECYDLTADKNSVEDSLKDKKIYCMDSCVYWLDGKALTVGCEDEVRKKGTPTKCPDADRLCENMIFKSKGGNQGGGNTITNNQGGGPTTPARRHGNRATVPNCLIGSMAILLFAASQYVTILN